VVSLEPGGKAEPPERIGAVPVVADPLGQREALLAARGRQLRLNPAAVDDPELDQGQRRARALPAGAMQGERPTAQPHGGVQVALEQHHPPKELQGKRE
jgi:hypothetical protein